MDRFLKGLVVGLGGIAPGLSGSILPITYPLRFVLSKDTFLMLLHIVMSVTGFLFVLDFSVKKPDWTKLAPTGCRR